MVSPDNVLSIAEVYSMKCKFIDLYDAIAIMFCRHNRDIVKLANNTAASYH